MAIIAMPDEDLFVPRSMDTQMVGAIQINRSPVNGAVDIVDMIGDHWQWVLDYGDRETEGDRDAQRGFFDRFRSGANLIRCWPIMRPFPRGTLRGAPTLGAAAVEGANVIIVVGTPGSTLLPGDFLGIPLSSMGGGLTQLVEIHTATGTGTITCTLVAPLRKSAVGGAAVVWNKPTADFMILSPVVIPHGQVTSGGFTVEMEEFIP